VFGWFFDICFKNNKNAVIDPRKSVASVLSACYFVNGTRITRMQPINADTSKTLSSLRFLRVLIFALLARKKIPRKGR